VGLTVSPDLISFDQIIRFHGIQYGGQGTERDLDTMLSNRVTTNIPKSGTIKFLRWMQKLQQSTSDHDISYANKGKVVPLHAMEALGGRGDTAPTHSRPRH
jgi:hypothetical protein